MVANILQKNQDRAKDIKQDGVKMGEYRVCSDCT